VNTVQYNRAKQRTTAVLLIADQVVESGRRLQASVESLSQLVDVDAMEKLVLVTEVGLCFCT